MNLVNVLIGTALVLSTHAAAAKAEVACAQCATFEQLIVKMNNNAPDALRTTTELMSNLNFSKSPNVMALEAAAYVRLALTAVKLGEKVKDGDAADYFAGAYRAYPSAIKKAMGQLDPADRTYLERARVTAQRGLDHGDR